MQKDINCPINGRELCNFLGCEGCEKCSVRGVSKKVNLEDIADNWDTTLTLIPDDIDELHTDDSCRFCKDQPGSSVGYEMLTLKHREPVHKKGMILGLGPQVDGDVGSMVDIPVCVCNKCKKFFGIYKHITLLSALIAGVIAAVVVMLPGINGPLVEKSELLPLLIAATATLAGYIAGIFIKKKVYNTADKRMYADPLEIPVVKKMTLIGWKPMQANKRGEVIMSFKKRKIRENLMYKSHKE